ncbi:DUF433 domain-containing protein [Halomontanus rarus]|uniref:DUF433 domain-containing protein n=1 Tax=Halomontanus rarus TaxID=3034020 RepID=UPI003CE551EB
MRTPDVLGGFPRLVGRQVGVHHVFGTLEAYGDESEVADQLEISTDPVRASIAYAESYPMLWPRSSAGARSFLNASANGTSTLMVSRPVIPSYSDRMVPS